MAAGVGAIGLWLATGSHGRLYYVHAWIPLVRLFRVPARFIVFSQLALAVTSASAFAQVLRERRSGPGRAPGVWAAWGVAVVSGAAALWLVATGAAPDSGQRVLALAAGPALLAAAALLLTLALRGSRAALVGLVIFAAADLALYGLGGTVAWHDFVNREALLRRLDTRDTVPVNGGRLVHGGFPDLYTLAGYRLVDGYLGLVPARQLDYQTPQAIRVSQAAYVSRQLKESAQLPAGQAVNDRWYALTDPLPRARLVTRAHVSQQPAVDLAAIDVDHEALTTRELSLAGDSPGTAALGVDAPGDINVTVNAGSRQLLLVSESFDDGWHATLDGQPVPVERVNGDFLGCVVTAGTHEVRFQFHPAHLDLGAGISLSGFALAVALLCFSGARGVWRKASALR